MEEKQVCLTFSVKLSCVCLMFAYRKKIAYSYPRVTPKVTHIAPTHLPFPPPT